MVSYAVPLWMIITTFVVNAGFLFGGVWGWYRFMKERGSDMAIFIDKNNRFEKQTGSLKGLKNIKRNDGIYHLTEDAGNLNSKGKVLYVFSIGRSTPMQITHAGTKHLEPSTLKSVYNNRFVEQIAHGRSEFVDMMLLVGAIGGIIAGISGTVNLLIALGIITV